MGEQALTLFSFFFLLILTLAIYNSKLLTLKVQFGPVSKHDVSA